MVVLVVFTVVAAVVVAVVVFIVVGHVVVVIFERILWVFYFHEQVFVILVLSCKSPYDT